MKRFKKLFALFTAFSLLFSTFLVTLTPVHAEENADVLISQLIGYYTDYMEDSVTDIERILVQLKSVDKKKGEAWEKIMHYWLEVNGPDFTHVGEVPQGLPNDNSMSVVIFGFALNDDGTMKEELVGRLETGLAIAKDYPQSYAVVTGGGTAKNNPNVTEGGLMGDWLLEHGLDASRLIVENRAQDTVGNAKNTYEVLKTKYKTVNKVVLVTSDYHVPRGCILYYTKFVLEGLENNSEPLSIISNAGYKTGSLGYESVELQARGICQMAGINMQSVPRKQKLSVLTKLEIKQNKEHVKGEEADLTITAYYDNGFSRDVTKEAVLTGFDKNKEDDQTITITHSENNHTMTEEFKVITKKNEVVSDKKQETKKEEKEKSPAKTGDNTQLVVFAALFLVSGIYLLMRMNKS